MDKIPEGIKKLTLPFKARTKINIYYKMINICSYKIKKSKFTKNKKHHIQK